MESLIAALDIAGLALLAGMAATWLFLLPAPPGGLPGASPRGWFGAALVLLTFTSLMELLLRASALADVSLAQAWREVPGVLAHSDFGRLWILRLVLLAILLLSWPRATPPRAFAALVALAIAFVLSATGHLGDEGALSGEAVNNTIHILAGCLWGGSVVVYALTVLPALRGGGLAPSYIAETASRLSTLAGTAFALVVLTGLYNAWEQLGSLSALWRTDYGRTLLVKLLFVAAMAGVGAFNRFVAVPAVQAWARPPQLSPLADAPVRRFLALLRIDVVLFIVIVAVAATLANSTPPTHQ